MGLLDQKTSQVADLVLLDENTEAQFQIIEASLEIGQKTGREFIALTLELPNNQNVGLVYAQVMGLLESDEARKADNMLRRLRIFKQAIGLESDDQINLETLQGVSGYAIFGVEDTDTGKRNYVKRFSASQAGS